MSKIDIDFTIETEGQKQAFDTKGILKDNVMIFHDEKDQKHTVQIDNDRIHYIRAGDPSFDFVFEEGAMHKGDYYVGNQQLKFDIQTHQLTITETAISLTYTLRQGDIVINHSELFLKYEIVQEA